jgi:hypothetical protein
MPFYWIIEYNLCQKPKPEYRLSVLETEQQHVMITVSSGNMHTFMCIFYESKKQRKMLYSETSVLS